MFENEIESNISKVVEDLTGLLNINTVMQKKKPNKPFGEGVYDGLKYVLEIGEKYGFGTQNYCGYCGQVQAGKGNYTVGVVCNLDIKVMKEVKNDDGKIYGAGALMGKGALISILYAMKILESQNLIPSDKRIRLVVLCDRLSGTKGIEYYKEFEQPPEIGFTPDGVFPVIYSEKGTVSFKLVMNIPSHYDAPINIVEITGGGDLSKVPDYANIILNCEDIFKAKIEEDLKSYSEIEGIRYRTFSQNKLMRIEILGKEAKSCEPQNGINAISHAIRFLSSLDEFIDRREFISEYERLISTTYNGEKIGCSFEDADSGRFTMNVAGINLLNDYAEIDIECRFPASAVYTDVFEKLNSAFKYSPLKIESINHIRPVSFLEDSFVVKKLNSVYSTVFHDNSKPYVTEGTSFAREMSNTVCFGPESKDMTVSEMEEEYISIDYLKKLIEVYAESLYELLS